MPTPENNGIKVYTLLVEINQRTGQPTGRVKPNIPSDPNYIAPAEDLTACPLPGPPSFNHYNVDVMIGAGFTATIQLWYSGDHTDQTANGEWNIVDRSYDYVIFDVTAGPPSYTVQIVYQNGTTKTVNVDGNSVTVIPGPFTAIQSLSIVTNTGDYNADYNDDFYN